MTPHDDDGVSEAESESEYENDTSDVTELENVAEVVLSGQAVIVVLVTLRENDDDENDSVRENFVDAVLCTDAVGAG